MATVELKTLQDKENQKGLTPEGKELFPDSPQAFEKLFSQYYQELCRYCIRYVKQEEVAEEVVQDVFIKLWQRIKPFEVKTSIRAYLYTSVKNSSLNYLKSQFARQQFEEHDTSHKQLQIDNTQESLAYEELLNLVTEGVEKLPEQCRTIFEMSRSGGYTYQEISKQLNISPKTVENQMGIALKKLKEYLRTYWDLLVILLVMLSNAYGNF